MNTSDDDDKAHWYVMRDLKRRNARQPAYKQLEETGFEVFVPMKQILSTKQGKRCREMVPVIQDLLFVHTTRRRLDPQLEKTPTLQFRYARGDVYRNPMTVRKSEMERFIRAVKASENPEYYLPGELAPGMYGRPVYIVGGPLDGCEGKLLTVRGSRIRRLLVELPGLFSAGVRVEPEYIRLQQSMER